MKRFALSLILFVLASAPTFASESFLTYSALLHLRFPESYQGQAVTSVLAHVGLHTKDPSVAGGREQWLDAHDVLLTPTDEGFAGTASLSDILIYGSRGTPTVYGPKVSYRVTFKSGKSTWINDLKIFVSKIVCSHPDYPATGADQVALMDIQEFLKLRPVEKSSVALLMSYGSGGACIESFLAEQH